MRELLREILHLARENNSLAKENNRMLKGIINAINAYARNADNENANDFGRNVIANLISTHIGNIRRL